MSCLCIELTRKMRGLYCICVTFLGVSRDLCEFSSEFLSPFLANFEGSGAVRFVEEEVEERDLEAILSKIKKLYIYNHFKLLLNLA